jgi:hypothetical protein
MNTEKYWALKKGAQRAAVGNEKRARVLKWSNAWIVAHPEITQE